MRTLDAYLLRDILVPFAAGLALFVVVALCAEVLKVADAVTGLGLGLQDLAALLTYSLPPLLGVLLPISALYACLLGIGRLAAERELLALAQCGASPFAPLRVTLAFGLCTALLSFALGTWGEPWGIRGVRQQMAQSSKRALIAGMQPNHFYSWTPGLTLWAAGRQGKDLTGVLLADHRNPNQDVVVSAARAALISGPDAGDLLVVMHDGEALLTDAAGAADEGPDPAASHVVRFVRGTWRLGLGNLVGQKLRQFSDVQELSLSALWRQSLAPELSANARASRRITWHRKFANPASAWLLCGLAVPLGARARSQARARGLLVCCCIVAAYYYVGRWAELDARAGGMAPGLAAWLPNAGIAFGWLIALWRLPARRA